jgi:pimeloyl-ACP methyl ester carboxylesterase
MPPRTTMPHRPLAPPHRVTRRAPRRTAILAAACAWAVAGATPLRAQRAPDSAAVSVAGRGPATYVLLSGMVGGVAGFRRLEAPLLARGFRVVIVDPYRLSLDSADVSFAALARRVDALLASHGVDSARVVGHAHGAGVALRLAAGTPGRVSALYFLDVGALADHRSPVFSASLRLAPLVARLPGGRRLVRDRFLRGLRQSAGRRDWLDAETKRAYAEPLLSGLARVVPMAMRLARAREPEPVAAVVARVRVPVAVLLGGAPHSAGPEPGELAALEPLGARLRVEHLAGVGHFPHEESPAEVARLITPAAEPRYAARR